MMEQQKQSHGSVQSVTRADLSLLDIMAALDRADASQEDHFLDISRSVQAMGYKLAPFTPVIMWPKWARMMACGKGYYGYKIEDLRKHAEQILEEYNANNPRGVQS